MGGSPDLQYPRTAPFERLVGQSERRILIVDDDPIVRRVMARALRWRGHEVHEAMTMTEGIELLLDLEPDLVVVDFHLPDGTGQLFAREARALLHDGTPPLILASAALEYLDENTRRGFVTCHRKPVVFSKLLDDVERFARRNATKASGVRGAVERAELRARRAR